MAAPVSRVRVIADCVMTFLSVALTHTAWPPRARLSMECERRRDPGGKQLLDSTTDCFPSSLVKLKALAAFYSGEPRRGVDWGYSPES